MSQVSERKEIRTRKDVDEFIKQIHSFRKELSKDKEKSREFLISTGIYTKTGKLSSHYK